MSFQKTHPKVLFNIESSERLVDLVAERIDVAIRVQEPKGADLVFRKLMTNQLVLVASPQYLKKYGVPKNLKDLSEHTLLTLSVYDKCRFIREKLPLSKIAQRQNVKSESGIFLTEMALAGAGIAVRSLWDVSQFLKEKSLVQVLPQSHLEPFGDLYLVSTSKASLNRRTTAFIEHVQKQLGSKQF